MLAMAIDLGRIAIWDTWTDSWMDRQYCKEQTGFACFFHRLTNCSYPSKSEIKSARANIRSNARVIRFVIRMARDRTPYPILFEKLLHCAPVGSKKYWWRQQAACFMVRPNERTIGMMDHWAREIRSVDGYGIAPCGSASMHIRHGDKGREMELFSLDKYLEKLDYLRQNNNFPITSLPLPIFVSTEDDEVIRQMLTMNNTKNINFFWLQEELHNGNMKELKLQGPNRILKDLTTLRMALTSFAFVGTLRSNWNRLIEELRSTVGQRARAPFYDLSSNCSGVNDCKAKGREVFFGY